jgi:hypothetical protein
MGHVVSISLLTKLLQKGIISPVEAADLLDDALLRLEEWAGEVSRSPAVF